MNLNNNDQNSFINISFSENCISKVSREFTYYTGYSHEDLKGKTISEFCFLMKILDFEKFNSSLNSYKCYLFSKNSKPLEVSIFSCFSFNKNERVCFFSLINDSEVEEKFQFAEDVLGNNEIGISIYDFPTLQLLKTNEAYLSYLKFPYNELKNVIGIKKSDIVNDKECNDIMDLWMSAIKKNKPLHFKNYKHEDSNKVITYWNYSIIPVIVDGKIKYIIETHLDVTEHNFNKIIMEKQADEIREQKEQLETIIENITDALFIFNKEGEYIKLNKTAREFYDESLSNIEVVGDCNRLTRFYDTDNNQIPFEQIPGNRVLNGETLVAERIGLKYKDGIKYTDINGTPIFNENGEFTTGILCCRDTTELVKYEEVLQEQNDCLNHLIDTMNLSVIRLSVPETKVTALNRKAFSIVKSIHPEIKELFSIKGEKFQDILPFFDDKEIIKRFNKNKREKAITREHTITIKGEEQYYNLIYHPIIGLNGSLSEIVVIIIDLTKEKKAKYLVEKNLKMQEEFFANMSHELKTPLNIIFSTIQLLDFYNNSNSLINKKNNIDHYIKIIKQNCYRLTKLVNNIVDISKIESGYFEIHLSNENIVSIIEGIVQSVAGFVESKGLSIVFDTNVEDKIIACDPNGIERVMLNLISNAIKFSNKGDTIFIDLYDKGETVDIIVKDTGIGISKENLEIVFQRFKQDDKSLSINSGGTGIGLCLVKSIVEMHKGSILLDSEEGKGSKFTIKFPSKIINENNNEYLIKNDCYESNYESKVENINIEFADIYG
ncbi:PAS domain-containing sensor histidine kinase [Clostridium grantii]|uniref:histidine kinase n=1 Tax=Clostridium grantii DSM 8605 TaxID=1121316 RepID=A0A1M5VYC3_9CLOT|nr:PAS domain-containing sensor histidine kinase [Clostridium grantii]SHH80236.1 His Kinase A (phospho-acceptor) domain-containing protein [Clostridium grantii DSM 8605]